MAEQFFKHIHAWESLFFGALKLISTMWEYESNFMANNCSFCKYSVDLVIIKIHLGLVINFLVSLLADY